MPITNTNKREKTKMLTIELKAADAVAIASLIAAIGGGEDVPVLAQVRVSVSGTGKITATATNRFMITTYTATAESYNHDGEFGLSAKAAKFIIANVKRGNKWNTPEPVEIIADVDGGSLSIRHGAAVFGDTWPGGKFPAVESLLTDWQPAADVHAVRLRTAWLGVLGKLLDGFTKVDYWLYELGSDRLGRADRPGPVKATAGNFTALIMPNLIK